MQSRQMVVPFLDLLHLQVSSDRGMVLGSDVDASYLGEIQGIESLVLVPALVGTRALSGTRPCGPRAYQISPRRPKVRPAPRGSIGPVIVFTVRFRDTSFVTLWFSY